MLDNIKKTIEEINSCDLFRVEVKEGGNSSYLVKVRFESYCYEIRIYGRFEATSMLDKRRIMIFWSLTD